MPMTEIDAIFSKGKERASSNVTEAFTATATTTPSMKESKKRKKKKVPHDSVTVKESEKESESSTPCQKRKASAPEPETIVDPSLPVVTKKRKKAAIAEIVAPKKSSKGQRAKPDDEDESRFKDSRGTGPRRKTEEGFSIYKEDELGIGDGGDTPLCPFDCDCCF